VDGFEGVVEEIQTRATLIKTWDGFLVVIPNATIYTQQITVFNAYETRRTTADFVVGRDADVDAARALIVAAVRGVEGVLAQPPPDALVTDASGYGVTVRARWWTDAKRGDYLAVRDRVIPAVHRQLIEHGVDLPSPAERRLLFDRLTRADGNHRPARETAQGRKVV
jgi:small conductance mechanosensitive channel